MILHTDLTRTELWEKLKNGAIQFGGNRKLKIYGTLNCKSGKRMSFSHRVFFATEQEALDHGYRPCGHCLREKYRQWKANSR
jgi:methylphosphotriester-DNA--protein-cysteine methyltransferase